MSDSKGLIAILIVSTLARADGRGRSDKSLAPPAISDRGAVTILRSAWIKIEYTIHMLKRFSEWFGAQKRN